MLAVFSQPSELPQSPRIGSKRRLLQSSPTPDDEVHVHQLLDGLYASLPRRQHAYVTEHYLGGANAMAWVEGRAHGLASDGEVSVLFKGTLALASDAGEEEDAQHVLRQYRGCFEGGSGGAAPVLGMLAQLRGPWAFVIYDRSHGRIVAARDPAGGEALAWGTSLLSQGLLFASDRLLLQGGCSDADDFPPGGVFVSDDFSTLGQLSSFDGALAGGSQAPQEALCRVESGSQLARVASRGRIEAN